MPGAGSRPADAWTVGEMSLVISAAPRQVSYWVARGLIPAVVRPAAGRGSVRLFDTRALVRGRVVVLLARLGLATAQIERFLSRVAWSAPRTVWVVGGDGEGEIVLDLRVIRAAIAAGQQAVVAQRAATRKGTQ